jgi:hypothetical protein
MPLYLTGFYESRIRSESQKITQKVAGKKYDDPVFTTPALSMFMVDFLLQAAHWPYVNRKLTHGLCPPTMRDGAPKVKKVLAPVCCSPNPL